MTGRHAEIPFCGPELLLALHGASSTIIILETVGGGIRVALLASLFAAPLASSSSMRWMDDVMAVVDRKASRKTFCTIN